MALFHFIEADRKRQFRCPWQVKKDRGLKVMKGGSCGNASAPKTPYDQCIGNIVALLQQISQDHGDRKAQHGFSLQVPVSVLFP